MNQHLIAQAERLYRHLVTTGQHLEGDRHDKRGRYNRVALRAWMRWRRRQAGRGRA